MVELHRQDTHQFCVCPALSNFILLSILFNNKVRQQQLTLHMIGTSEVLKHIHNAAIKLNCLYRASDRLRQKMGNFAAFSREIMWQKRAIMRQIM